MLLLLLPAGTVVWLGVRLIVQERQLELDRQRRQRVNAADQIVELLTERLSAAAQHLDAVDAPGDDAVTLVVKADRIETRPAIQLVYRPGLNIGEAETALQPGPGDDLEFRRNDLEGAAAVYRQLAGSGSPATRAMALVSLGRVLRKAGRPEQALRVYDDLARVRGARVDGVPAELAARRARCRVLDELKRTDALHKEAAALRAGLFAGTWEIDRGTFVQYADETAAWLDSDANVPPVQQALAEAVDQLWARRGTTGRTALRLSGVDFVLLWRTSGDETRALIAGPDFQRRHWFSAARSASADGTLQVGLASADGVVFRTAADAAARETFRRRSSESGLPWDVVVASSAVASTASSSELTILTGLILLVLLVIAGGYVIARAVSRELAVARLQSDFVASVSHEFRTPLTSLRQFTDLLHEAEDLTSVKRKQFYAAQARAADRLQRLVESLLDFKRMESGSYPYRRQGVRASSLVKQVVAGFRPEAGVRGFEIEFDDVEDERTIDGDADALSLALWNLLDNAVKYSGESRCVSVSLGGLNGSVEIGVRDRGIGVPAEEQREIFRQFVRGRDARIRGIKGTGIGLAMVRHIVHGHGGRITLDSAPGRGSTFTIVLPTAKGSA